MTINSIFNTTGIMEYQPLYRDWLSLTTHLLWCYDGPVHGTDSTITETQYTNNGAWLVRSGWAEVEHDGTVWRALPGEWLVVKPDTRIQRYAKGTHLLSVSFEAIWPDGQPWISNGLSLAVLAADYPDLERYALRMVEQLKELPKSDWDIRHYPLDCETYLELQGVFGSWLRCLVHTLRDENCYPSTLPSVDDRVLQALRYIQSIPVGEKLNSDELADYVSLSQVHLIRLFRHHLNKTPKGYFEGRRLEYAQRCLSVRSMTVKEVSLELGFIHLSHFNRWFRKYTDMPPRDYRRNVLRKSNQ